MPENSKAVFLSYASQDAEAARRICETLRQGGVEVWFDADGGLEHGDEWDAKIRRQIKECVLFLPIISASTQARHEGYFRIEWDLAAERARGIASGVPFILPVVIDDTREPDALVPDRFRMVQWTRLRGGEVSPDVLQRFLKLWSHRTGVLKYEAGERGTGILPVNSGHGQDARATPKVGRRVPAAALVAMIVVIASLAAFFALRPSPRVHDDARRSAAPSANAAPAPLTGAQKLVAQAQRVYDSGDELNRENLSLADDLVQQALKLDPAEPTAWELAARLSYVMVWQQIDESDARREAMQRQAVRAVALAPNSVGAQVVALNVRLVGISWVASGSDQQQGLRDVERELTTLAAREPGSWQVQRALGMAYRFLNRPDDSIAALRRAVELSAGDPSATADLVNVLERRKQLSEAETVVATGLARKPTARLLAEDVFLKTRWHGDLAGAEGAIASWPGWLLQDDRGLFMVWQTFFWKREPEKALGFANRFPRDYLHDAWFAGPRAVLTARAQESAGHAEAAQADWRSVVQAAQRELARRPEDPSALYWQAWALARLGQTEEARALCRVLLQRNRGNRSVFLKGTNLAPLLITAGLTEDALEDVQTELTSFHDSNTLTRAVLELDPAFDSVRSDSRFQRLVESAPAPAKNVTAAAVDNGATSIASPASKPDPKSVVVLPFANLSGDPAQEYFSDGLTEEILNALARERDLRVVPRTSAFSFKGKNLPLPEIARALNVAQVVEGSVQRAGNSVRINCTFTRVADGFAQPLPQFQREMKDASGIFALEDEVARAVVEKLTQRTTTTAPVAVLTKNPAAYDAYLRGRSLQTSAGVTSHLSEIVRLYQEATRLDPDFALPWARLSQEFERNKTNQGNRSPETAASAKEGAANAVRLDPNLPEAHLAMSMIRLAFEHDPEGAQRELDEALRLRPNDPEAPWIRARIDYAVGRWDDALANLLLRAADLDPQNAPTIGVIEILLTSMGRFADAERVFNRSWELSAPARSAPLNQAMNYLLWTGDASGAQKIFDTLRAKLGGTSLPIYAIYEMQAHLRAVQGDFAGAAALYEQVRTGNAPIEGQYSGGRGALVLAKFHAAQLEARLGNRARATEFYDEALAGAQEYVRQFPEGPEVYDYLARVHAARGEKPAALDAMETAMRAATSLRVVPTLLHTRTAKAEMFALLGETAAAVAELRAVHDAGWGFGYSLRLDLEWEPLRGDAKFQQLMKEAEARADAQPRPQK